MKTTKKPIATKTNQLEKTIGRIMRWGVTLAIIIMVIGLLAFLLHGGLGYPNNYYVHSFKELFSGLAEQKPYSIMMLGIFILILTPVLRVVASIYSFYREHDWLYVVITALVLLILIASFILGIYFRR
ncbi:DUF1634 domain-containing protein [Fructilactobacillus florum]|uniref:Integral membrane protein n=1 Tax=Fructilactobacillus florum DSM 22689 = JCM 16035 TaxID=1423745 RepID=A0A0R2CFJ9_9LACO|nr:DUF1634 domain-containing protein [Fructilactobacillus florum]KRM90510.1 hypothetical protein FC87_GL001194 [Fructilactobacillus florum DSM 22689 = JCM 16035]